MSFRSIGVLLLLLLSSTAEAGRYALVIGNGAYPADSVLKPLSNPVNDANDMGALLQQHGFRLVNGQGKNAPVLNGTKREMDEAIRKLLEAIGEDAGSEVVVYFSGHGLYLHDVNQPSESANYLIPVGEIFRRDDPVAIKYGSVNAHALKDRLERVQGKAKVLILDACRDRLEVDEGKGLEGSGEFRPMEPKVGLVVVHATTHSYTARGSRVERYSRFTGKLLPALSANAGKPLTLAFGLAAQAMEGSGQTPRVEGTLSQEVCLTVCTSGGAVAPPVVVDADKESWEEAKGLNTVEAYQVYLGQYPQGKYAGYAKAAMKKLQARVEPEPRPEPDPEPVVTGKTHRDAVTGMELVLIPKGCFEMGSPANEPGRYDVEGPQHRVY